jgi:hypothetical protein
MGWTWANEREKKKPRTPVAFGSFPQHFRNDKPHSYSKFLRQKFYGS